MKRFWQLVVNVVLYGTLIWFAYDSTIVRWDPWFAFVVIFLIVLAVGVSLVPSLRAAGVSPGEYPYDE